MIRYKELSDSWELSIGALQQSDDGHYNIHNTHF